MNLMLSIDNHSVNVLSRLSPHLTVHDLQIPQAVSNVTELAAPYIATMNNWLRFR